MAYHIYRISPVYCQITDAATGSEATMLPTMYETEALASKLAGIMSDYDHEHCGDDDFRVVAVGDCPYRHRYYSGYDNTPVLNEQGFDDIPF